MTGSTPESVGGLRQAIGPGLLLAGVSVGVSHLVQSTRAGAMYGLGMAVFIVLAMATKYPAYRFTPRYTLATGVSMIEGFRRQGRWALGLAALLVIPTAIVAAAAITLTTAGVAKAAFSLDASPITISAVILLITAPMLMFGGFRWVDLLMKPLMLVLAVSTVIAAALAVPLIDWSLSGRFWPQQMDMRTILFTAALIGYMPSPLDASLSHSLWTQAKVADTGYQPTQREASIDFHIGYLGTLLLAICFLLLGTGVMHGSDVEFVASAGGFANQVIALYEQTLGGWSRPLISICALAVMYSTVFASSDAFGRLIGAFLIRFRRPEVPGDAAEIQARRVLYLTIIPAIYILAMVILVFFMKSFKMLIDFATTMAFLTTPVIALLIHRCMMSADVPEEVKPGRLMWTCSVICIGILTVFTLGYLLLLAR